MPPRTPLAVLPPSVIACLQLQPTNILHQQILHPALSFQNVPVKLRLSSCDLSMQYLIRQAFNLKRTRRALNAKYESDTLTQETTLSEMSCDKHVHVSIIEGFYA